MAAVSLGARHQHNEKVCVIRRSVRERLDERHLRQGHHTLGNFLCAVGGFLERSAFGERIGTDQFGLVIGGNPIASHQVIETKRGKKRRHANQYDYAPMRQRPAQHPQIDHFHRMQNSLGVGFPFASAQLQEARAHHRRQREGYQQRNKNGHRHRPPERIHVFPCVAGHKSNRQKNDHQRESRGHHCQPDFLRGFDRRMNAVSSLLFHESKNIFKDNDGVVDHDAHGQRQRQERYVVKREVHAPHQGERGNDRGRDGHGGNQDGTPVPNEEPDYQARENTPQNQMFDQRMDRSFDEIGNVVNHLELNARRHLRAQIINLAPHVVRDAYGVDAGLAQHLNGHDLLPRKTLAK